MGSDVVAVAERLGSTFRVSDSARSTCPNGEAERHFWTTPHRIVLSVAEVEFVVNRAICHVILTVPESPYPSHRVHLVTACISSDRLQQVP